MKALYRFHDAHIISYKTDGVFIHVFFETSANIESAERETAAIMKELSFQMIRLDTARRTRGIRELLVARSLYATCIEPERDNPDPEEAEQASSWRDDQRHIFATGVFGFGAAHCRAWSVYRHQIWPCQEQSPYYCSRTLAVNSILSIIAAIALYLTGIWAAT